MTIKYNRNISVIGGGCAGYSIVKELSKCRKNIIDFYLGSKISNNNFWGFWNFDDVNDLENVIKHKWEKWKIIDQENETLFQSDNHPYCVTSRNDWIQFCKNNIKDKNVSFLDEDISYKNNYFYRKDSEKINSDLIIDCRSFQISTDTYLQHFKGFIIETDNEIFDDSTAILMDFRCDQSNGIQFIYLLPITKKKALIEPTIYSYRIESDEFYYKSMEKYLKEIYKVNKFKIISEEKGAIPLASFKNDYIPNVVNLGLKGNANRISSGYTFYFIQKQVKDLSRKVNLSHKINNSKIHSKLINFLDRIFIDVLKSNPSKAPQIFQSFGKSFNGDDMAFFMSSKIRIIPILKMIFNLPTKIFIKSFIRCLFND